MCTNMMSKDTKQNDENTTMDYIEEPWVIINSYFKNQHLKQLVRHQTESYNNFVDYQIL